ncbi:hypothetical protein ACWDTG_25945 [Rhodococcus zopfii]
MLSLATRTLARVGKTLTVGRWSPLLLLLGIVIALLAFGGSVFGPVTMQVLQLLLVLFILLTVVRLLVGGGRR